MRVAISGSPISSSRHWLSLARSSRKPAEMGKLRARLKKCDRGVVVDGFRVHRSYEAQFVGDFGRVRKQLADPGAAPSVPCEFEAGGRDRKTRLCGRHAGQTLAHPHGVRQFRGEETFQLWFVIEQIHLRRRAGLKQIDHALGPRRKVGKAWKPARSRPFRRNEVTLEQRGERGHTDPDACEPEKVPAGD